MTQQRSYCRTCGAYCRTVVTTDPGGRIQSVRGDKDHVMSRGYACMKGVRGPELYDPPERLLPPLKRRHDGSFEPIDIETALDEVADRLSQILARHDPRAIACFRGTPATVNAATYHMAPAWMNAIGSPSFYSTYTIDQSAKLVTAHRLGAWSAGRQEFHDADVWLFAGNNVMVSNWTGFGAVSANPALTLKEARARGMKIIVVDPRRTETAGYADLHLQLKPGTDIAVAGAMLRLILDSGWHDTAFCEAHVEGLERLRDAIAPFTLSAAADISGVPAQAIAEAAEIFARGSKRGIAVTGTGPDMGPHSNLAEHLYEVLNVVCGRYLRAGEQVRSRHVLAGPSALHAEVVPPLRPWERPPYTGTGHGTLKGEMMSGVLADEILHDGPNRVRALIVTSGNPANALPDRNKTVRALESLDLLVTIDPFLSETARLADYVFAPFLPYERPDLPLAYSYPFSDAFAQYTPAVSRPPDGAALIDDWGVFWGLAKRLDTPLTYHGIALDMTAMPTADDLLSILARNSLADLDDIKRQPGGLIVDLPPQIVQPTRAGPPARFSVMPADVGQEITSFLDALPPLDEFPLLLVNRRLPETINSAHRNLPSVRRRRPYNPAWLHPDAIAAAGLEPGAAVWVVSSAGRVPALVESDETLRIGVVSMAHGFGALPGDDAPYEDVGGSTPCLVSTTEAVEAINAMPRMTAIPVRLERRATETVRASPVSGTVAAAQTG